MSSGKQFHTIIISREIIKPSNPTPCNLNIYNLSEIDIVVGKAYVPIVFLYPNLIGNCRRSTPPQDKARVLKKSLSQSLTRYYPFAGRLSTHNPTRYIDCNDEGVVFLEAKIDCELDAFQLISGRHDENLNALFADAMVSYNSPDHIVTSSLVGVQLNHFVCGGVALAVSISHILGDACTFSSFMSHWASVAFYGSDDHKSVFPLNPSFIHYPPSRTHLNILPANPPVTNHVMRTFVFPNSKLNELKNKVVATGSINNPTRIETLTSLLYKAAVAAAATNSGSFNPSYLLIMVNIRSKFVEKLAQTVAGNLASIMMLHTRHISEVSSLDKLVGEIKKEKLQLDHDQGVQSVQETAEHMKSTISKSRNNDHAGLVSDVTTTTTTTTAANRYLCSSSCGFPFNKVDFGWGKPQATAFAITTLGRNVFALMDTPDDDGIQAQVILERQDMEIFENDKEMLSFCNVRGS